MKTGCNLTAVEYGEQLSELCKEYPNLSVITNKFEDKDFLDDTYDLIYSASAFHWVPENIGYPKVFSMLKSDGVFARFANHPYRAQNDLPLSEEIDRIYGQYYYTFYN